MVDSFGIDVVGERARTVGCATGHHLNAAGAALPPAEVVDAVVDHLRREEREGGYEAAAAVRDPLETVYQRAAALVGAAGDEIAILDSASTGLRVTSSRRSASAPATRSSFRVRLRQSRPPSDDDRN